MIISGANSAGFLAHVPSSAPQTTASSYSWQRDGYQGGTASGQSPDYASKLARCQWLDGKLNEIDSFWKTCDTEISGWNSEIYGLQNEISSLKNEDYNALYKVKDLTYKLNDARSRHQQAKREQQELENRSEDEKAGDSYHQWKFYDANTRRTNAANEAYQIEQEIATLTARKTAIGYDLGAKSGKITELQNRIRGRENDKQYYTYDMQAMRDELRNISYELSYHPTNPLT